MRASPYNNPLFAEGLASLVQGFIGNPAQTAQNELMAAQAKNENMTADYRQMMDAGLEGDLSTMMVRALQAGSQYSGNAPKISAAINQNNAGILGMPTRTGGGSSSGGGGGTSGGPEPLNPLDVDRLMRLIPEDQREKLGATILQDVFNQEGDPVRNMVEAVTGINTTPATEDTNWLPWVDTSTEAVTEYVSPFGAPPAAPAAEPVTSVPQPASEAEYQALPSGTRYMAPDGTIRTKP